MNRKRSCWLLAAFIFTSQIALSQSVAINADGSTANSSSILDVKSTIKGLLIPRMLKSERNAISSPATGLMVYQTGPDSTGFYMYNGTSWEWALTTSNTNTTSAWQTTGNSGLSASTNFIGTTDNVTVKFRVFNSTGGQIDYTNEVTYLGSLAGNTSTGIGNAGFGAKALFTNNAGQKNTAVGTYSLSSNTSGNYNTGVGYYGGAGISSGTYNTAVGTDALGGIGSGSNNTAIGAESMSTTFSGSNNTAIGYGTAISSGLTNATAIGYNAYVTASNSLVLGNGANVGIGTNAPQVLLHVAGTANLFKGPNSHTGFFYNGTASCDGIELVANNSSDAFASIQRGDQGYCLHLTKGSSAVNQGLLGFYVNGTDIGHVDCNVAGTSVAYYTTSDERLKENIRTSKFGLEQLMMIKVADYNYKADTKKTPETGFLAQQLYSIYPQAVKPGGDDPKANPWTIDYGRVTPILVKAVQEQQQLIQKQDAKIASMEKEISKLNEQMQRRIRTSAAK